MTAERGDKYRELLASEQRSALLYDGLASAATGERRQVLEELAAVERRHAEHWADKIAGLGQAVPDAPAPGLKSRLVIWLAGRTSIDAVLPYLERAERSDAGLYQDDDDATAKMAIDERSHARVLTQLRDNGIGSRDEIRTRERWHRGDRSGALRAAVFGVNDGLVSNASLVMGFAGSGAGASVILFAGLAGLVAGALSMAAGEYVSMSSQRESYQREISLEEIELRDDPEAEAEELALIYRAKGMDREDAEHLAAVIMKDRETALDTMAREELGIDPDELGSPWSAALSSLVAFALGAVVVVLPYLFGSGTAALVTAVVLAAVALFGVGATLGLLNGRGGLRSGVRQLLVGGGAALVVFGIGHLAGMVSAAS